MPIILAFRTRPVCVIEQDPIEKAREREREGKGKRREGVGEGKEKGREGEGKGREGKDTIQE
jgi:hypothetical protein